MSFPPDSPFNPDNAEGYRRWREEKLRGYPRSATELLVELADPRALSESEYQALAERIAKANMAIYATTLGCDPDKSAPRALAERFGLSHLDSNLLADDDGLTSITVSAAGDKPKYIPYTNRSINWHCDGYYNTGERQIRGMLLHCVRQAEEGGENLLLDPEIAYLELRDRDVAHVRALMEADVMTIPPGLDGEGKERGASIGPVFSWHEASGSLHMRYTARKRNIEWKQAANVQAALEALEDILEHSPYIIRARLEPGMGLLCNNVLHTRTAFRDAESGPQRLLYRARYFERIRLES